MNLLKTVGIFFIANLLFSCTEDPIETPFEDDLNKQLAIAITSASKIGRMHYFILESEYNLKYLPNQDPGNPITPEKVELGKMLFFDTGLAQDAKLESGYETYSCATCHIPSAGFLPGRKQGIADGAYGYGTLGSKRLIQDGYAETDLDAQGVRPLTTLNVAYMTNTLWSGLFGATGVNTGTEEVWNGPLSEVNHLGFVGLESQNIEGVELHRLALNEHVLENYGYRELFDKAFPDLPESERYSKKAVSFALGAYLRTLLTTRAPFQLWLKGDWEAMTDGQKKGALIFFGKGRCSVCHNGPSFSSMNFHALGTKDLYEAGGLNTGADDPRNLGRGMFTGKEEDNFRFKVPQLYNLRDYVSYFHGSSKESLEEVVEFKVKAQSENSRVPNDRLSSSFEPLNLTQTEKNELIDFLRNGLYDPDVERYAPQSLPSGNCFPNNDKLSRKEIGCE